VPTKSTWSISAPSARRTKESGLARRRFARPPATVTAMRNIFKLEDVLDRAYRQTAGCSHRHSSGNGAVPRLLERVRPVHEVVKVDHFIPGCPPSADLIYEFVVALLEGRTPILDGRFWINGRAHPDSSRDPN